MTWTQGTFLKEFTTWVIRRTRANDITSWNDTVFQTLPFYLFVMVDFDDVVRWRDGRQDIGIMKFKFSHALYMVVKFEHDEKYPENGTIKLQEFLIDDTKTKDQDRDTDAVLKITKSITDQIRDTEATYISEIYVSGGRGIQPIRSWPETNFDPSDIVLGAMINDKMPRAQIRSYIYIEPFTEQAIPYVQDYITEHLKFKNSLMDMDDSMSEKLRVCFFDRTVFERREPTKWTKGTFFTAFTYDVWTRVQSKPLVWTESRLKFVPFIVLRGVRDVTHVQQWINHKDLTIQPLEAGGLYPYKTNVIEMDKGKVTSVTLRNEGLTNTLTKWQVPANSNSDGYAPRNSIYLEVNGVAERVYIYFDPFHSSLFALNAFVEQNMSLEDMTEDLRGMILTARRQLDDDSPEDNNEDSTVDDNGDATVDDNEDSPVDDKPITVDYNDTSKDYTSLIVVIIIVSLVVICTVTALCVIKYKHTKRMKVQGNH
jgi:hypothetical protein